MFEVSKVFKIKYNRDQYKHVYNLTKKSNIMKLLRK